MKTRQITGLILLLAGVVAIILKFVFTQHDIKGVPTSGIIIFLFLAAAVLVFNFSKILFDPEEEQKNSSLEEIVVKIRNRQILYNNIAIILFLITIVIIFLCFFLFFTNYQTLPVSDKENAWVNNITAKVGASVLLIFLVQILFRVFKYLLRVAAFYSARADAIEFILCNKTKEEKERIELKEAGINMEKLMTAFTPNSYDISDLEKVSLLDGLSDVIKAKVGK